MALTRRGLFVASTAVGLGACSTSAGTGTSTPTTTPAPSRVATLDRARAGDLLSLGMQPVAACEAALLRAMHLRTPLGAKVPDAGGQAGDYDLAVLRAARPQLIIGSDNLVPVNQREALQAIAPLVLARGMRPGTGLADVRQGIDDVGRAVQHTAAAQRLLDDLNTEVDRTRAALVARVNGPTALVLACGTASAPRLKLFTTGSTLGQLGDQVGVVNLASGPGDDQGLVDVDLSGLSGAARIGWWAPPTAIAAMQAVMRSSGWRSLPAVRRQAVAPVLAGQDPFGGIAAVIAWCGELHRRYGSPSPSPVASASSTPG